MAKAAEKDDTHEALAALAKAIDGVSDEVVIPKPLKLRKENPSEKEIKDFKPEFKFEIEQEKKEKEREEAEHSLTVWGKIEGETPSYLLFLRGGKGGTFSAGVGAQIDLPSAAEAVDLNSARDTLKEVYKNAGSIQFFVKFHF